jgi:hypothetical protein
MMLPPFHVVTDNTNFEHDPTHRLRARGNAGGVDIEANFFSQTADLIFNGIADIYTYRYDGFAAGDFIKLQLNGDPAPKEGAGFGGFLFDETFEPNLVPEPTSAAIALLASLIVGMTSLRKWRQARN